MGSLEPGKARVRIDSRFLRLVLAASLALWAPGQWCCCAAPSSAPNQGSDVAAAEPADSQSSCCQAPQEATPSKPRPRPCAVGCGNAQPGDSDSCGCIHAPLDANLTSLVALAAHERVARPAVDLLAAMPPQIAALVAPPDTGRLQACRGSPPGLWTPSLYTLHCLLLV